MDSKGLSNLYAKFHAKTQQIQQQKQQSEDDDTGYSKAKSSKSLGSSRYNPLAKPSSSASSSSVGQVECDGGPDGASTNNIYVCGFPKDWPKTKLEELFSPYGHIVSSRILYDTQTNLSRGIGFIRMAKFDDAVKAIDAWNGKVVEGGTQTLQVRFAKEKQTTDLTGVIAAATTTGGFAYPVAADYSTLQYFMPPSTPGSTSYETAPTPLTTPSTFPPTTAYPPPPLPTTDPYSMGYNYYPYDTTGTTTTTTGYPPGYGTPTSYYGGTSGLTGPTTFAIPSGLPPPPPGYQYAPAFPQVYDGSSGDVSWDGLGPAPPSGPVCLFVLHVPSTFKDDDLHNIFKDYGTVTRSKVMVDPATGQSRGYGFVTMSTYMEAQTAMTALNGYHVPNTNKYLKVSFKTQKASAQAPTSTTQATFGSLPPS